MHFRVCSGNINYYKHNLVRTWGQLQTTVDKLDIDGVEGSAPALENRESIHERTPVVSRSEALK